MTDYISSLQLDDSDLSSAIETILQRPATTPADSSTNDSTSGVGLTYLRPTRYNHARSIASANTFGRPQSKFSFIFSD